MKLLRYAEPIVALAEHRHFGRAARALGVTQPALSMIIRKAERESGVRLFDRARGEISLTVFGETAVRHCTQLLLMARDMTRDVDALKKLGEGRLVISCGTFPAEMSGHRAIGRLLATHPKITCSVLVNEWHRTTQPVIAREADLALAELGAAEADPRLVSELIGTHPSVFYCRPSHPLARIDSVSVQQLASYPWALMSLPPRVFSELDSPVCNAGKLDMIRERFVPAIHIETIKAAIDIVQISDAISAAPLILIHEHVRAGKLTPIRFSAPWCRLNYGFIYLRDRTLSPAARAFISEVRKVEAELVQQSAKLASDTPATGPRAVRGRTIRPA